MDLKDKYLFKSIECYKEKIEYNANCRGMSQQTRDIIIKFGDFPIPPQVIIIKKLVNFMASIGLRFNKLKKDADAVTRKWQQQADQWLRENNLTEKQYLKQLDGNERTNQQKSPQLNGSWRANQGNSDSDDRQADQWSQENNLTEKQYLEHLDRNERSFQNVSPQLNGTWRTSQKNSGSDDRQNYHSSSSQELESPDSQRANQRSSSNNHRSNHNHSFVGSSSSPLQLEHPATRNLNSAEFNANLSIDPKEVIPFTKVQESPVKPDDRFCIALKEKMFTAVKSNEPILEIHRSILLFICRDQLKLPLNSYPNFVRDYLEYVKSKEQIKKLKLNHGDQTKNGKIEKNRTSTHIPNTPHNSHNMPSTSLQGAKESLRSCLEFKHDRKKQMESSEFAIKTKLKEQQQSSQGNRNLLSILQQSTVESSNSCLGSKHDRKKRCTENTQSVVNAKELKLEQQTIQNIKNLPSMSQQGEIESSRTCPASKHDRKRRHIESSQSIVKIKEKQQFSEDSRPKYGSRTECVVNGKESKEQQLPSPVSTSKGKETAPSAAKAYVFKDEYYPAQDSKLKLDSKQALEGRNCDKNHIRKRESSDQSAMLAITSSKKERTSMYHGGKKSEVPKLKDLSIWSLNKGIKQTSDPTKYINRNVDFNTIEPILVVISPEKLQKLEEQMKYLKVDTDGVWRLNCAKKFKSRIHLIKKNEDWRTFYHRCCQESEEKLRNVAASISASASKAKPDRQIKFTTVDGPPTKRPKTELAKSNSCNSAIKPLSNSCHPSNSRSDVPVPPKGMPNHVKASHKTIKKDAPLMHKAKRTWGQLHRIHRN